MNTSRFAIMLGTASLLLLAHIAPAQISAPASNAHPVPDLTTHRMPPHEAKIAYRDGLIQVVANDSSLNLTLLQIARATGIRVSGTATEERIFGTYGPSTPAALFRTLLQGTGTNMLLTRSSANATAELILTPQNGPVTPPSVHSTARDPLPSPIASVAPAQPGPGANTSPANPSNGQPETDSNREQPAPPAPVPLTSGERALLVDRLQQQQRQADRSH